jgi:hypothetical protein
MQKVPHINFLRSFLAERIEGLEAICDNDKYANHLFCEKQSMSFNLFRLNLSIKSLFPCKN